MAQKTKISIDPVTRIEGHLKAEVVVENGKVIDAKLSGGMYRGFESILRGRDPRDAIQFVERVCGVCPTAHATASSFALENAAKTKVPANGRITRNLCLGANFLQSHILHFYHLAGQDFIQGPETAPFIPRYTHPDLRLTPKENAIGVDQYIEALEIRALCHELVALFGGRMPHLHGITAGGATEIPLKGKLIEYATRFKKVQAFVKEKYLPIVYFIASQYKNLLTIGHGYRNAMCVGGFPSTDDHDDYVFPPGVYINGQYAPFDPYKVTEDVHYSFFNDRTSGQLFTNSRNVLDMNKKDAYSFVKAPLFNGYPLEVGPMARMWICNKPLSKEGQAFFNKELNIKATHFRDVGEDIAFSLLGRHIARAEEAYHITDVIEDWLKKAQVGEETYTKYVTPSNAEGLGITEAPRGALMHYINIIDGKIDNYQIIPATLWNTAPRSDTGLRGALEEALINIPVPNIDSPVNVARLIRAFDP